MGENVRKRDRKEFFFLKDKESRRDKPIGEKQMKRIEHTKLYWRWGVSEREKDWFFQFATFELRINIYWYSGKTKQKNHSAVTNIPGKKAINIESKMSANSQMIANIKINGILQNVILMLLTHRCIQTSSLHLHQSDLRQHTKFEMLRGLNDEKMKQETRPSQCSKYGSFPHKNKLVGFVVLFIVWCYWISKYQ